MNRAEQAAAMLRAVFHGLPDATCLLVSLRDEGGRIVDFEVTDLNFAGEQLLRRSRESVVGRRIAAVFLDEAALVIARQVVVSGESVEADVEGVMRRMEAAGDGVVVTLRRVGDAAQTSGAYERVVGGLVHDLNNLLTPILAYTNFGLAQVGPGEPLHEELLEIRRAAERATNLVQQVQLHEAPRGAKGGG